MVTDDQLLAAVRSAGEPGTESHRLACRVYRRAVLEWKAGTAQARREDAARAALCQYIALLAAAAAVAGWLDERGGCGTHGGYNRHAREKTLACPACLEAERRYSRARKRVQRRAKAEDRWRQAA